ncbi:MAG: hypothetical protein P8181_06375 [bacterium]
MSLPQRIWTLGFMLLAGCSGNGILASNLILPASGVDLENARLLAQCLTGDIRAPDRLADEIVGELAAIQFTYGHRYPHILGIQMHPPLGTAIEVAFDEESHRKALEGSYEAWDDLNREYGATLVKIYPNQPYAYLEFEEALNLCSLSLLYKNLPGVIDAYNLLEPGEYPTIYIRTDGAYREYLYFYGEVDCLAGCIYEEYYYFKFNGHAGIPQLAGIFTTTDGSIPDWWSEVHNSFFESHQCPVPD